ncbi:CDP-alcohol phosphatidyltransferase family protein [Teichococcus aestuarii]|uniref:CDP-alcohol phosphatidyltransferase family protein n=1 Tax=Teichococcus aestuarii TaxID=568898 RepID=UPI001FE8031C|nr:CDP-alcohol phosphatidyltransferase family protein [Pseudoroseomonas aestuarii]
MPAGSEPPRPPGRPPAPAPAGTFTLPNLITLARLCMVPATIWLIIHGRLDIAFFVFVAAGVSDALDGWLARRQGSHSTLGAMLDPVADKALLICTYVSLAIIGVLPDWLALLVVFRDLLIMGGVALFTLLGAPPPIQPLRISKANTVAQIALAALALLLAGFGLRGAWLLDATIALVACTTVLSGLAYVAPLLRRGGAGGGAGDGTGDGTGGGTPG